MSEVDASELVLREPTPDDGAALWELVRELGKLDLNSPYAYLLVGRHLASTSVVADLGDGELVGFVSAYRPPIHDDVVFVWQVGVHPKMRGHGLARRMLMEILGRDTCHGVRWVESTVTPNNLPSQRLFRSLARQLDTEITVTPYFPRDLFPTDRRAVRGALPHRPDRPLERAGRGAGRRLPELQALRVGGAELLPGVPHRVRLGGGPRDGGRARGGVPRLLRRRGRARLRAQRAAARGRRSSTTSSGAGSPSRSTSTRPRSAASSSASRR